MPYYCNTCNREVSSPMIANDRLDHPNVEHIITTGHSVGGRAGAAAAARRRRAHARYRHRNPLRSVGPGRDGRSDQARELPRTYQIEIPGSRSHKLIRYTCGTCGKYADSAGVPQGWIAFGSCYCSNDCFGFRSRR
jgi:DNA-directed RNA polymerase subunit RPC12/RpoP